MPVLIVEDDDEIREILAEMLADEGFAVTTASNGRDALDLMRSAAPRPSLVVLDLMMPVMDGWQLRREMLADPDLSSIPVVVVSGAADIERMSSTLAASKILTKPVKWPQLRDSIRAYKRP